MSKLCLRFCVSIYFFVLLSNCDQVFSAKPNIVLIMVDDMGAECLKAYGGISAKTPHIDHLISRGIRFTNCYSNPLCTPSRVQIMTGKYNYRNYKEFGFLDPSQKTFGHLLQSAGYKTCIVGKWQLNGVNSNEPGNQDSKRPHKIGFDEYCLWQVTKRKSSRYADPVIEQNGNKPEVQKGKYGPDLFCDYACNFIKRHQKDPFFLYYPMVLTHSPFVPTPDSPDWNDENFQKEKKNHYFTKMVEHTDHLLGRIYNQLDSLNLLENTVIIYTADNGTDRRITTQTKNGAVKGGKGLTINSGIHVPLIISQKGVTPENKVCNDLIDFTDFVPTLLDIAATPLPEDFQTDGHSFYPVLVGKTGTPRKWIFCHYDARWPFADKHRTRFAMNHRYKLYHDGRFFDFINDPLEKRPVKTSQNKSANTSQTELQKVLDSIPIPWDSAEPDYPLKRIIKRRRK